MQDFKMRHTEFIRAVGTAAGRWTHRVDVPFDPKYCIVRQLAYTQDHGIMIIRAPFVQGGLLGTINGESQTSPQIMLSTPNPVRGQYEFQVVTVTGEEVDMTAAAVGHIAIILEFVG